jgi:hypothetical protein
MMLRWLRRRQDARRLAQAERRLGELIRAQKEKVSLALLRTHCYAWAESSEAELKLYEAILEELERGWHREANQCAPFETRLRRFGTPRQGPERCKGRLAW